MTEPLLERPLPLSLPISHPTNPTRVCVCRARTHEKVVVDLYYDGSKDIVQTVKQCEEAMEQVVMNEHSAAATAAAVAASSSSPGQSEWSRYTSPKNAGRAYWYNQTTRETVRKERWTYILMPRCSRRHTHTQREGVLSAIRGLLAIALRSQSCEGLLNKMRVFDACIGAS